VKQKVWVIKYIVQIGGRNEMTKYIFKSKPDEHISIPRIAAKQGEELVKSIIGAKTPSDLADIFNKNKYLGDSVFNKALDLSERNASEEWGLVLQDGIYFLNYLNYAEKSGIIDTKKARHDIKYIIEGL
jgi:hypothetical protein